MGVYEERPWVSIVFGPQKMGCGIDMGKTQCRPETAIGQNGLFCPMAVRLDI